MLCQSSWWGFSLPCFSPAETKVPVFLFEKTLVGLMATSYLLVGNAFLVVLVALVENDEAPAMF